MRDTLQRPFSARAVLTAPIVVAAALVTRRRWGFKVGKTTMLVPLSRQTALGYEDAPDVCGLPAFMWHNTYLGRQE